MSNHSIGTWLSLPNESVAEIFAKAGYEWVVIDLEHSSINISQAESLIRTIDLAGSKPFIRLSGHDPSQIKRVLDAGAKGILAPMIDNVQQIKTVIDANGNLDLQNAANWDAKDVLPNPDDRKIWSIIPNTDYTTDYNNFIEANSSDIAINFKSYGNPIEDYHSVSNDPLLTRRCVDTAVGIEDGVSDDTKGLINFLRGKDYFDYDGDCDLTETRVNEDGVKSFLGDFYHSELLTVGPPDANTSFTNKAQEAYWRSSNGYKIWAASPNLINRKEIIYVGANDGMLHAFNSENGFEEWAFIPPLLFGKLPLMADPTLNKASPIGGGTQAKYGVDGSPVVHDMYIKHPISEIKDWYTILFVPYGRGGNGFSILDVTNPDAPLHLLSIFNETLKQTVYVLDHDGDMVSHAYVSKSYEINQLKEAKAVTVKFTNDEGNEVCDNTGDNQCYLSNTWTLVTNPKMPGLTKLDFEVTKDVTDINFDTAYNSDGDIVFTFDDNMRYVAYDGSGGGYFLRHLYIQYCFFGTGHL